MRVYVCVCVGYENGALVAWSWFLKQGAPVRRSFSNLVDLYIAFSQF